MRYISDDNKVFNTEQECLEYEQNLKNERLKRGMLEKKRKDRLDVINNKYQELQGLIYQFEKDYGVRRKPYFAPVYELMNMLCE